jgi:hypothetical protein
MVGALKKWLGIDVLERENLRLAKAEKVAIARADEALSQCGIAIQTSADARALYLDHEVRIAFCESQLTSKQSTAKIVPKAHKTTFRQFAEAASRASEPEESNG